MASVQCVGDLGINQELDFQYYSWAVERVGWGRIVLTVLAALLGCLAQGCSTTLSTTLV